MFYKLNDRFRRARFATQCESVLRAPAVAYDPSSNLALLSMLQHKDLLMFLLAVKSFARYVRPAAVFVLNDGSLTDEDRAVLARHIAGVTVLELSSYRSAACPAGGCWERLLAVASLVEDYYVIQLDSDTLTLRPIDEVRVCVAQQRAFALGTWDNQEFETMRERVEHAKKLSPTPASHVQLYAEAHFDRLPDIDSLRYVRGCAGFAGFARKSFTRAFVERVSAQMLDAIGGKWKEWGSEQVMSNIVIANIARNFVLPHPKYADCVKMKRDETAFIHFIGSCRFNDGTYARLGAEVIGRL